MKYQRGWILFVEIDACDTHPPIQKQSTICHSYSASTGWSNNFQSLWIQIQSNTANGNNVHGSTPAPAKISCLSTSAGSLLSTVSFPTAVDIRSNNQNRQQISIGWNS